MRRRGGLLLLVSSAALGVSPLGSAHRAVPARVQIVEKEYALTLSRLSVPAGKVIVQVIDFGMDDHDLVVQSVRDPKRSWHFATLAPQEHATQTLSLSAGRYTLSCSLPGHRDLGMVATLSVH